MNENIEILDLDHIDEKDKKPSILKIYASDNIKKN